jgi:hypothetical protein
MPFGANPFSAWLALSGIIVSAKVRLSLKGMKFSTDRDGDKTALTNK